jgi:hypothetical protein
MQYIIIIIIIAKKKGGVEVTFSGDSTAGQAENVL